MPEIYLFTATWCMPCRKMKEMLKSAGIKVKMVDIAEINSNPEKYDACIVKISKTVLGVPTMIRIADNGDVAQISGLWSLPSMKKFIETGESFVS